MKNKAKSIGRWISVLYRYGQCYLEKELQPYNIGSGQFIFLAALFTKDGVSQEQLANYLYIDKGTTARAIKKLEGAGYVERKTDPKDKRANKVFITEKALEIKPTLQEIAGRWTNFLSSDFTEEERDMVIDLLKKMSEKAALLIKGD